MRHRILILAAGAAVLGLFMIPDTIHADEGMWLFNNPPREQLKKYGFEPTDKWLDHVQKSSRPLQHRRLRLVRLAPTAW